LRAYFIQNKYIPHTKKLGPPEDQQRLPHERAPHSLGTSVLEVHSSFIHQWLYSPCNNDNTSHSVGLLGREISPSQRPLHTQDSITQEEVDKHPCLKRDSNSRSQRSSVKTFASHRAATGTNVLDQGWANYGPQAKYGPLRGSMLPAEVLENVKKMRFRKTFVRT
jgi:hypothetical protein